jgi:hypothetical protein
VANAEVPWMELDPAKAELGATHGAYVAGSTLLQLPPTHSMTPGFISVVVVGLMTCGGHTEAEARSNAERQARDCPRGRYPEEFGRAVSRKTLLSWAKGA